MVHDDIGLNLDTLEFDLGPGKRWRATSPLAAEKSLRDLATSQNLILCKEHRTSIATRTQLTMMGLDDVEPLMWFSVRTMSNPAKRTMRELGRRQAQNLQTARMGTITSLRRAARDRRGETRTLRRKKRVA